MCLDLALFTLVVPNLIAIVLGTLYAPGLLSTLCTAFYALFGMLLRGGKTVEKREFLQDSMFRLFDYNLQLLYD